MLNMIKNFKNDESGAVTVDWVVLTAAVVGLGLLVINTVSGGLTTAATDLNAKISTSVTPAAPTAPAPAPEG